MSNYGRNTARMAARHPVRVTPHGPLRHQLNGMGSVMTERDESLERLRSQVAELLDEARRQGAGAAEVGVSEDSGLSVTARMGSVETVEFNRDRGFGVTVYFGQRRGTASTSDCSPGAMRDTVRAACNIARYTAEDSYSGLADAALMAKDPPDLQLYSPWGLSAEEAGEMAIACEARALAVAGISNSEGATVGTHEGRRVYGNSHGFLGAYRSTRHQASCSVLAGTGTGMERDYWYSMARDALQLDPLDDIGRIAAERALARLNPRSTPTGRLPVLFAAEVASGLIGHLLGAISGGALYRRASFLLDCLGQQLFPTWVTIDERPLLPGALGSGAFDDDGVATRAKAFIQDGVLASYVLSAYSARKLGAQTTGNAGGVHNLFITHGDDDLPALLIRMGRGVYITELMGQGVNTVTGDYSRGAAGFWVEGGEIQYPIHEATIAGNLREMFKNLVAVGNDFDARRSVVTGSILVDGMTVAGG